MSIVTGQTFYSWKNFSQNAQPGRFIVLGEISILC
jgi:hypothetical protein